VVCAASAMPAFNLAMRPGQQGQAMAVYSAGTPSRDGRRHFPFWPLEGHRSPGDRAALFPTKDPPSRLLVLDVGANMDCKPAYLHQFGLLGRHLQPRMCLEWPTQDRLLNIRAKKSWQGNDLTVQGHPPAGGRESASALPANC